MDLVNVRHLTCTHYIGRNKPPSGQFTGLGTPFRAEIYGREKCIEMFEAEARKSAKVLEAIRRLPADAILGCWCSPQACHGNVIIKIWKELHGPAA